MVWNFWKKQKWNNKKIAFVAILISTSVAFVLIINSIIPIAAIPTVKFVAGGLPVKITGYIFGPVIGATTGLLCDLLTFAIRPTFIHYWYLFAWTLAGLIPGVVGFLMHRRWKYKSAFAPRDEVKYNNLNFFIALGILLAIIAGISAFIILQPESTFTGEKILIHNKYIFLGISVGGLSTMVIGLIIFRFFFKPKTFNAIVPIVIFSAILEMTVTPLLTMGDMAVFNLKDDFMTIMTGHFLLSPMKIWVNLIVIYFAYKVTSPLILNKTNNGWKDEEDEDNEIKLPYPKDNILKKGKKDA